MREDQFEGTLILERLAEAGKLDEFWEAIDSDNFSQITRILKMVEFDDSTISFVIEKAKEGDVN